MSAMWKFLSLGLVALMLFAVAKPALAYSVGSVKEAAEEELEEAEDLTEEAGEEVEEEAEDVWHEHKGS